MSAGQSGPPGRSSHPGRRPAILLSLRAILLAWAGKDTLVAWDIGRRNGSEFANRLVLVTIGSEKTVPLSGFRGDSDQDAGRWDPLFVRR
ncbi:hypothetical protein [Streptomyces sp. NPDC056600]|uniref:hypothetical protein n=1 Tax=Streptomyces sp. NPDC056600 TaxID=3345874 RepID=UPI00368AE527